MVLRDARVEAQNALWDRFLRVYWKILLVIGAACFLVASAHPLPWPRSALGKIVLALIVGLIGLRAVASMMVRVGGTETFERFDKTAEPIQFPLLMEERIESTPEGNTRVLPRAWDAVSGVFLGVFGVALFAVASAEFVRGVYFLILPAAKRVGFN